MTAEPTARPPSARLNPFAFASGTDFRFILLVATVFSAAVFVGNAAYLDVGGGGKRLVETVQRCIPLAPQFTAADLTDPLRDPSARVRQTKEYLRCMRAFNWPVAGWMLGGAAVLFAVAAAIYWLFPQAMIRRRRLVPFPAADAPDVAACLDELCARSGLPRRPVFLVNPLTRSANGLAFGRLGRYYVVLDAGLVAQFDQGRDAFRAVVLHELAHLRNGDVTKTYFTVSTWYAFLLVAVLPYALMLFDDGILLAASVGWRVLALAALVYLTRNAVLRARELYADVRASDWGGGGSLARMFERLPSESPGWRALLRNHPSPSARATALRDTRPLFDADLWEAAGTGVAATLAFLGVQSLVGNLTTGLNIAVLPPLIAALVVAPLVAAVVGVGVWRTTFAALAQGRRPPGVNRLALAFVAGCVVGRAVAIDFVIETASRPDPGGVAVYAIGLVVWGGLLFIAIAALLRWLASGAEVWLEAVAATGSPKPAYRAALTLAGGMMVLCFGALFPATRFVQMPEAADSTALTSSLVGVLGMTAGQVYLSPAPLTMLALISLWAFPFAALVWRGRSAIGAAGTWAFLGEPARPLVLLPQPPLSPRAALRAGVVGGLVFCAILLVVRVGYRLGVDEVTRDLPRTRILLVYFHSVLGALVQMAVAAWAARRARRMPVIHGMFAAFAAGGVATVGSLALNLAFGGSIEPSFAWIMFRYIVHVGALPALVAALLAARWRRRGQSEVTLPAAGRATGAPTS